MALQASTSQAPTSQAPQMVPPLCQPLPSSGSQPATPYQQAVQLPSSLRGGESPSTPPLTNLQPRAVKMLMVTGGRELKAEMITHGLSVTPGECVRGPPLGRPVSRCHTRRVSTPLVHLARLPQIQHWGAPCTNAVAVRGLQGTP